MLIRPAVAGDASALARIYGHHVLHGVGTFEEAAPDAAGMLARMEAVTKHGLPYLVADDAGRVVGFAYAGPFRTRAAYRYTVEDSVYIDPDRTRRGIGKALLAEVIAACEALGMRQMLALIGDSANAGSIGLHLALGFREAGVGRALGFKQGRWVDVVWMRRPLGAGEATAPTGPGLEL